MGSEETFSASQHKIGEQMAAKADETDLHTQLSKVRLELPANNKLCCLLPGWEKHDGFFSI